MWSDLALGPSFKAKRGEPNIKVLITCLLLVLEVCNVKPTLVIGNHGLKLCQCGHIWPWVPVSDLPSGEYKFASVHRCDRSS